jgi:hypothetical protein
MNLISLGLAPKSLCNNVKKADGFIDRLAIYSSDDKKYYKVIFNKKPSQSQINWIIKKIKKWDYITYLQIVFNNGSNIITIPEAKKEVYQ